MPLNCDSGEDSWKSLGQQGDQALLDKFDKSDKEFKDQTLLDKLEKEIKGQTLLDKIDKEIKVNLKRYQPWILVERAEAEAPVF